MFLSFLAKSKQGDIVYLPCYSQTWDKQGTGFLNERLLAISTKTQAVDHAKDNLLSSPQPLGTSLLCN